MQRILIPLFQLLLLLLFSNLSAQCPEGLSYKNYLDSDQDDALQQLSVLMKDCQEHLDSQALVYHKLGVRAFFADDYPNAIAYTTKAAELRQRLVSQNASGGKPSTKADTLNHVNLGRSHQNLGVFYNNTRQYFMAEDHLLQAIDLFEQWGSYRIIKSQEELGMVYGEIGDFDKGLKYLYLASQNGYSYDYTDFEGDIQNSIGYLENARGNYSNALKALFAADSIYSSHEEEYYLAHCYTNIGNTYKGLQNLPNALEKYLDAARIAKAEEDEDLLAINYNNIGVIYKRQGQLQESERYLNKALQLYTRREDWASQDDIFDNLGDIYLARKAYHQALSYYQKAIDRSTNSPTATPYDHNLTAEQLAAVSKKESLLNFLSDKANAWMSYYASSEDPAHLEAAIQCYQQADQLIDLMRKEYTSQGARLFWREKVNPIYESAIEVSYLQQNLPMAFYFMEKSKSVLLLDALQAIDARRLIPDATARQELQLKSQLIVAREQLEERSPTEAKAFAEAQKQVLQAQQQLDQFLLQLSNSNPEYHKLRYNIKVDSLPELEQQLLSDSCYLIEYFWGDQHLYLFGVKPGKQVLHRLPSSPQLQADLQAFLTFFAERSAINEGHQEFMRLAHQLYQELYVGILDDLGGFPASSIIIPDADLNFLPFDVLATSAAPLSELPFLFQQQMIRYGYSATVLSNQMKQRQERPVGPLSLYAVSPFAQQAGQNFDQLPYSQAEVDWLRQHYQGRFLYNQEASLSDFKAEAPSYSLIHLSTHAEAHKEQQQEQPEIVFSGDSTLILSELYASDFRQADLVILSACETGIGKVNKGEGVMSLNRGFTYAGATSLVSSLWKVNDHSTSEIFQHFYRHLSAGASKAWALHQAKRDYLDAHQDELSQLSPYTWAGLVYLGDDHPLELAERRGNWWLWGLGLAVGGLLLVWRLWRLG
ncbi:MAG: CHAT domain-containing tetratricopeptide repeat protein [Bacteroidota bacterium]